MRESIAKISIPLLANMRYMTIQASTLGRQIDSPVNNYTIECGLIHTQFCREDVENIHTGGVVCGKLRPVLLNYLLWCCCEISTYGVR